MKIAAFNVENLFDRAKALNLDAPSETSLILKAVAELNSLIEEASYSAANKARMIELLQLLDLAKSDQGDFALLRKIRGKFIKRLKAPSRLEVVASGRSDWVGWIELRNEPVNATAIMNTGRVIRDVDADVLAVIEAEGRIELKLFSNIVLKEVAGTPYEEVMVIDGNDDRGIDVGIMTTRGYHIGGMRSHIHDQDTNGRTIFSRDCPEFEITTPSGNTVWVLPNHFKSKFGGDNAASRSKRTLQAVRTAEIYNRLRSEGNEYVVVLGDLNDTPDSDPLQPLLSGTDLREISDHPNFDTGQFAGRGTYGNGNDNNKIDYLLLSPPLYDLVTGAGLFRMGAWPGKRSPKWQIYPEIESEVHVASDHHVIWADINI